MKLLKFASTDNLNIKHVFRIMCRYMQGVRFLFVNPLVCVSGNGLRIIIVDTHDERLKEKKKKKITRRNVRNSPRRNATRQR